MAAFEEKFAQKLASNDLAVRNRALKRLRKWIEERSALKNGFTEMEMMKLWKGLYVCMWHSDKPLVQEELAENIASLVYVFRLPERALEFVSAFFTTMAREWVGIDRLRLDKFYMLIRKVVCHSFQLLQQNDWNPELVEQMSVLMSEGPLNKETHTTKSCLGVQLHVLDVLLPELSSVLEACQGACQEACPSAELIAPALSLFAGTTNGIVISCIEKSILKPLRDEEVLQKLHVRCDFMAQRVKNLAISRETVGKNRKVLYTLCKRFSDLEKATLEVATASDEPPQPPPKKRKLLKKKMKLKKIKQRLHRT